MKTSLVFDTCKLVNKLNSPTEFYEIEPYKEKLLITKKYKNKRGRPLSVSLPKDIKISSEVVGLIVGEGFMKNRSFVFANSGEKAINMVFDFLRQFELPIKLYLEISIKNKTKKFIDECKEFWEKNLYLDINRVRLRREFNNITKHGTIHLILNNSLIAKLLNQIIKYSKKKIEKDKLLSINYLKGIIAAEGNINIKKTTNCVYMVRISATKKEEREHYRKCLEKAGVKIYCKDMSSVSKLESKQRGWKTTKGRAGCVIISKWENFIKILEFGLLNLSEDKKSKFVKHFRNNKFTKQFISFNYFLNKGFTMKQAQTYFGFKGRHLGRLLTLYKQGYISRRKINKRNFIYKLTQRYINLYKKFIEEGIIN